jgi:hypothetical protein
MGLARELQSEIGARDVLAVVRAGQPVEPGDLLDRVGSAGLIRGHRLHCVVSPSGCPVAPEPDITGRPVNGRSPRRGSWGSLRADSHVARDISTAGNGGRCLSERRP